jgi:hypothetical protein
MQENLRVGSGPHENSSRLQQEAGYAGEEMNVPGASRKLQMEGTTVYRWGGERP